MFLEIDPPRRVVLLTAVLVGGQAMVAQHHPGSAVLLGQGGDHPGYRHRMGALP